MGWIKKLFAERKPLPAPRPITFSPTRPQPQRADPPPRELARQLASLRVGYNADAVALIKKRGVPLFLQVLDELAPGMLIYSSMP